MTTYPTATPSVTDYNSQSVIFEANRVLNIAPCERLKICVTLDKTAYNAAILANGSTGTFDTNFKNAFFIVRDTLPPISQSILTQFANVVQNDASVLKVETEIRIPESWAGQTKYYLFEFLFRENGVFNNFRYHIDLVINDYDNTIPLVSATQGSDDATSVICIDKTDDACLTFTPETDKFLIPVFHIGSDIIEHNSFPSNDLDQLTTDIVKSFDGSKLTLDPTKLTEDFCLKMISKNDGTGTPVEPTCDPLTVDINTNTASCVNSQAFIVVNYTLQGLVDADVNNVSITVSGQTQNFSTATDNAAFQVGLNIQNIEMIITLENGCMYMYTYTYAADCTSTAPITQTVTL